MILPEVCYFDIKVYWFPCRSHFESHVPRKRIRFSTAASHVFANGTARAYPTTSWTTSSSAWLETTCGISSPSWNVVNAREINLKKYITKNTQSLRHPRKVTCYQHKENTASECFHQLWQKRRQDAQRSTRDQKARVRQAHGLNVLLVKTANMVNGFISDSVFFSKCQGHLSCAWVKIYKKERRERVRRALAKVKPHSVEWGDSFILVDMKGKEISVFYHHPRWLKERLTDYKKESISG